MDILDFISSDNYIPYNRTLARKIGLENAILFGALCGYQRHYKQQEFFREQEKIVEDTCLTEYAVRKAIKELKELNLISVIKKGLPAKYYYKINTTSVLELLSTSGNENNTTGEMENPSTNNKNNNKNNNNNKEILLDGFNLSEKVKAMVYVWLGYKKEKGQTYKPVGLNTLLKKIQKWQNDFGEDYVVNAIDSSITNNYAGLFPAKQQYKPQTTFSQRTYTKEQMNELFDDIDKIEI